MTSNLTAPVHDTQHFGSRPELAVADWSHGWPWPIHSSGSCQPGPGSVDGLRGGLRISWSRGQLSVVWCLRVSAETPGARFEHLDPADGDPRGGSEPLGQAQAPASPARHSSAVACSQSQGAIAYSPCPVLAALGAGTNEYKWVPFHGFLGHR